MGSAAVAGDPIGVQVVGLPMVAHRDCPVGRKDEAEMVEDGLCDADRVFSQVLVGELVRRQALVGEPLLPGRLVQVDRVDLARR